MKILKIVLLSSLLLAAASTDIKAQHTVDLQVFQPLPEIDLSAFIYSNNVSGLPRIMCFIINPKGDQVILDLSIEWQSAQGGSFQELLNVTTNPFTARDFCNDEFGNSDITIAQSSSNQTAIEELRRSGRPTGKFRINVNIQGGGSDSEIIEFSNPTQNFVILTPESASSHDIGAVLASWEDVAGVSSFKVKVAERSSPTQSLDDAIESGNPYVDADVGLVTVANLRTLLQREWVPGQEMVMQIEANIPGPDGGSKLFSNIVNFYLSDLTDGSVKMITMELTELLQLLDDGTGSDLLQDLIDNGVTLLGIRRSDGTPLTADEIMRLLDFLKNNTNTIIDLTVVN